MDIGLIADGLSSSQPNLRLRQGAIVSVAADGTATVTIAGSTTQVSGVKVASSCCPVPGATCWMATDGRDLWVLATLAPAGPAFGRMRKSTTQTVGTASWTELGWGSRTDTSEFGVTLGSTGITIVVPGLYSVTATPTFDVSTAGNRHARLVVNGSVVWDGANATSTSQNGRMNLAAVLKLSAADVVNVEVYQNSGGNLATVAAAGSCCLAVAWIGPSGA